VEGSLSQIPGDILAEGTQVTDLGDTLVFLLDQRTALRHEHSNALTCVFHATLDFLFFSFHLNHFDIEK
jgi:hypothetical protein